MRGSKPHNPDADYIIIDDIWFYKEGKGNYYLGNVPGDDGKRHPVRAHKYVWEKYNGKVPKGCSVHHIDHNPRNNDISNLKLLGTSEHASMHSLEHSEQSKENMLNVVHPAAVAWHKSNEGNDWHKQHYEKTTRDKWNAKVIKKCIVCGKEYETTSSSANRSKYCSEACKSKSPNKMKYRKEHQVESVCPICGKTFLKNKGSRTKCCSRECGIESSKLVKLAKHHLPQ